MTRRCLKRRFGNEYDADRALTRITTRSTRGRVPTRIHDCPYCGGWHLTSKARMPGGYEPSPPARVRRPRLTGPTTDVRALVLARDGYACVRCGASVLGAPYSLQHRRARGMGGTRRADASSPANLLVTCGTATTPGGCHTWMEAHPLAATALGWRIAQRSDPTGVPVRTHRDGWVLLDDHGGRTPAAAPHTAA